MGPLQVTESCRIVVLVVPVGPCSHSRSIRYRLWSSTFLSPGRRLNHIGPPQTGLSPGSKFHQWAGDWFPMQMRERRGRWVSVVGGRESEGPACRPVMRIGVVTNLMLRCYIMSGSFWNWQFCDQYTFLKYQPCCIKNNMWYHALQLYLSKHNDTKLE